MTGTVALIGGGEFDVTEDLDRELLELRRAAPTCWCCRRRTPSSTRSGRWPGRWSGSNSLGATARGLDVLRRPDALVPEHVAAVAREPPHLPGRGLAHAPAVRAEGHPVVGRARRGRRPTARSWRPRARRHGAVRSHDRSPRWCVHARPRADPTHGRRAGAESWSHDRLHRTLGPRGGLPRGHAGHRRLGAARARRVGAPWRRGGAPGRRRGRPRRAAPLRHPPRPRRPCPHCRRPRRRRAVSESNGCVKW